MFDYYTKKPFVVTSILCLLLFLTASIFVRTAPYWHFFIIGGFFISCFSQPIHRLLFSVFCLILCCGAILVDSFVSFSPFILFGLLGLVLFFHKSHPLLIPFALIGVAFLFHLFYVQNTPINLRQHDLGGVRYYMTHIITSSGINWLNFDSWSMYYLFHQPLHFILNGYLFLFLMHLNPAESLALELLQYVALFYVSITILLFAGLLNELNFSSKIKNTLLCLVAFNPSFMLLSGYISDDTPVLCWSVAVNYFLVLWYKNERLSDMLKAALCFAVGCLTKLSILMLVPAICCLFLYKLITAKNRRHIWIDICSFVIVAVPLSLLWVFRNHILFDMQFFNVPDTSPAGQNFYHLSLLTRQGDFSGLFTPFLDAPQVVDSNIILALIKTELFGEWNLSKNIPLLLTPAYVLYFLNIIIHILILGSVGWCLFLTLSRSPKSKPLSLFFVVQYLTIWGYIFKYAIDYPYVCSVNYRLFAQLLLSETLLGFAISSFDKQKTASNFLLTVSVCYATLSAIVYGLLLF